MRTFSQYIYKKSIRTRACKYPHPKLYQQKKRASYDNVRYTLGGGGDDGNGNGDSVDDDFFAYTVIVIVIINTITIAITIITTFTITTSTQRIPHIIVRCTFFVVDTI